MFLPPIVVGKKAEGKSKGEDDDEEVVVMATTVNARQGAGEASLADDWGGEKRKRKGTREGQGGVSPRA